MVLKFTNHFSLKQMFRAYDTWNRQNYFTPIILNVFMVFVTIFSMLLFLDVKGLWLIIWVNFMIFFMNLISYYLLPLPLPKNRGTPKFFIMLALHGLADEYSYVRN